MSKGIENWLYVEHGVFADEILSIRYAVDKPINIIKLQDGRLFEVSEEDVKIFGSLWDLARLGKAYYAIFRRSTEDQDARGWNKALDAIWEEYERLAQ